jgi:hypothetical protein
VDAVVPEIASGQAQRWRDLLELAKVLRADRATRARAVELLEQVASEAWGTACGDEAAKLISDLEGPAPPPAPDAAVAAFRTRWMTIQSLGDGDLPGLLARLDDPPGLRDDVLSVVVRDLRRWLLAEAAEVDAAPDFAALAGERPRHEAAAALAERIAAMPRLEGELRPALARMWEAGFGISLRTLSGEVRRACAEWAIDRAWRLVQQLEGAPTELGDEVRRLEQTIHEADRLRAQVEATLAALPRGTPGHWAEARAAIEWAETARAFLADERVPAGRREDLRLAVEQLLAGVRELAGRQASEARDLADLRRFWRHFQGLARGREWAGLDMSAGWFAAALGEREARLAVEIREAAGPDDLAQHARRLAGDLAELPPCAVTRLAAWIERLQGLAASWSQMTKGEEIDLPDGDLESLPAAFTAALPRYRALLARLHKGYELLDRPAGDRTRERNFRSAAKLAGAVLREVPGHARAQRLKQRAEGRRLGAQLDRALASWDVEGFLLACRPLSQGATSPTVHGPEEPYQSLARASQPLRDLARLAQLPELTGPPALAAWWQAWRGALAALPAPLPAAFKRTVAAEEERRRGEWWQALDRVLESAPSPERCNEALASLRDAPAGQGFESYVEKLRRCERGGRVAQLLAAGDLDQTAALLEELAGTPEYRVLQARLLVQRARDAGVTALAAVLQRHWGDVLVAFGEEAYETLEVCLAEAWQTEATGALAALAEVARRVARTPEAPAAVRAGALGWLRWLQVEAALADTTGAAALQQLLTFAESEAPGREERLRAQIARWERRGDAVALSWAFRAFPELFPGTDPAALLCRQSEEAAWETESELARERDSGGEPPAALAARIAQLDQAWHNLDDFLELIPHAVDRPAPPASFTRLRGRLAQLAEARGRSERLEKADLRLPEMRALWSASRFPLVELRDLPAAKALLTRVERLRPLTLLAFDQGKLREAAARCGSAEPHELEEAGLFGQAAERVRTIVEAFERAGMTGREMWWALAREYWAELATAAGDLAVPRPATGLIALARRFDALEAEEQELRRALARLRASEPILTAAAAFDPESASNRSYLGLYPSQRPGSRRAYRIFDRFARIAPQPAVLRQGARLLPAWIQEYLEKGVP